MCHCCCYIVGSLRSLICQQRKTYIWTFFASKVCHKVKYFQLDIYYTWICISLKMQLRFARLRGLVNKRRRKVKCFFTSKPLTEISWKYLHGNFRCSVNERRKMKWAFPFRSFVPGYQYSSILIAINLDLIHSEQKQSF